MLLLRGARSRLQEVCYGLAGGPGTLCSVPPRPGPGVLLQEPLSSGVGSLGSLSAAHGYSGVLLQELLLGDGSGSG